MSVEAAAILDAVEMEASANGPYPRYDDFEESGIEWMNVMPSHWSKGRIKFVSAGAYGSFTDGDWIESPFITNDGVRLVQCGNVGTGKFEEQGSRYIADEAFNELNCTEVKPNDVLICRLRSSPRILAGRACLAPD